MVVDEAAVAARMVAAGTDVVLIVDAAVAIRPGILGPADTGTPCSPGRLAVVVGDPADPAVVAAAAEMEQELFGAAPTSPPGPAPA